MTAPKPGQGPKAPVDHALHELADIILTGKTIENKYVSVAFPRFLYKMAAQLGWRQMIRANGKRARNLGDRPSTENEASFRTVCRDTTVIAPGSGVTFFGFFQ